MDNHATTPVDPRVLEAMLPYFTEVFGNAASRTHSFGWTAEKAVEQAREQVGALIGASGKEIVWTSGATESDNLAIKGAAEFHKDRGNHIITAQTEHKAVLDTCKRLEKEGFEVTYLPVDKDGRVEPGGGARGDDRQDDPRVDHARQQRDRHGEPGRRDRRGRQGEGRALPHRRGPGRRARSRSTSTRRSVDLASLSAHKMYGPKGVGALYVRRKPRVRITAQIDGGGHERGMRSGTLNVPGIVGFGKAAELCAAEMAERGGAPARAARAAARGDPVAASTDTFVNGSLEHRLPGNLNISFAYVEGEAMLMALKDVAVSSGSACTSASLEPSYVLRALGVGEELAHTSIRFGLGRFNTEEEVDYVTDLVVDKVKKLRELSPLYEMAQEGIDLKSISWAAH